MNEETPKEKEEGICSTGPGVCATCSVVGEGEGRECSHANSSSSFYPPLNHPLPHQGYEIDDGGCCALSPAPLPAK